LVKWRKKKRKIKEEWVDISVTSSNEGEKDWAESIYKSSKEIENLLSKYSEDELSGTSDINLDYDREYQDLFYSKEDQLFSVGVKYPEPEHYHYLEENYLSTPYETETPEEIHFPTPIITELDEIRRLREEVTYLRKQNLILATSNQNLNKDLTDLTYKYHQAIERSYLAIENLKTEITELREEIKITDNARTLKFVLPSSWLEEDKEEE